MAVTKKWKVVSKSGIWVRSDCTTDSEKIDVLPYGEYINLKQKKEVNDSEWFERVEGGWVCARDKNTIFIEFAEGDYDKEDSTPTSGFDSSSQPWLIADSSKNGTYDSSYNFNGTIANINAIHGVPYQFLPNADTRLAESYVNTVTGPAESSPALGRTYTSKIISKIPLMLLTPGRPEFMARYSKKDKKTILSSILTNGTSYAAGQPNILENDGRYYTFRSDHVRYFNFVNPMCRIASQYLGIGDQIQDGIPFKRYNWGDGSMAGDAYAKSFLKTKLQAFLNTGLPGYIGFYLNSDTQISESFGNDVTESSLASTINGVSDMAKELNFILGYSAAGMGADKISDFMNDNSDVNKNIENVNDMVNKLLGGNNFLSNLSSHLVTVARGGRLTFPQIWSDSSFSKSYDVSIKLISPDSDKLSIYLNVLVPLFHLLALVAPQSINANPNGYTSPFLIRAIYKGMFNIEMGIITNMNITKGAESGWTKEGIPTSIEVNFSIKDLYEAMSITSMIDAGKYDTMNNTALMDYIANCCGINIFKPELARQIDMWYTQHVPSKANDILYNIFGNIEQNAMQGIMDLYNKTPWYR